MRVLTACLSDSKRAFDHAEKQSHLEGRPPFQMLGSQLPRTTCALCACLAWILACLVVHGRENLMHLEAGGLCGCQAVRRRGPHAHVQPLLRAGAVPRRLLVLGAAAIFEAAPSSIGTKLSAEMIAGIASSDRVRSSAPTGKKASWAACGRAP